VNGSKVLVILFLLYKKARFVNSHYEVGYLIERIHHRPIYTPVEPNPPSRDVFCCGAFAIGMIAKFG